MANHFKPLKFGYDVYEVYGFDVETYGNKNDFLMGSIIGRDFKKVFWNREDMINCFLKERRFKRNCRIFATNLGFDFFALFGKTKVLGKFKLIFRGTNLITASLVNENQTFRMIDTFSFAPFSVAKIGDIVNFKKMVKPQYITDMRKPDKSEYGYIEDYNLNDSTITYKFGCFLQKSFNFVGCEMKTTIASTAMDLFKRQYLKEPLYQEPLNHMIMQYKAYYGGRTEAIKRGYIENMNYYDFNSLYPSVMLNEFPHPNTARYYKSGSMGLIKSFDGVTSVNITAPHMNIPLLPFRTHEKLIFPIGTFSGYYTNIELRKALELGYKINSIGEQLIYLEKHKPFKDYVEILYKKRLELKRSNDNMEIVYKLLLNSLYGKFAQHVFNQEDVTHLDNIDIPEIDELRKKGKVSIVGEYVYFSEESPHIVPSHIFPIYSAYVTSYARIKLFEAMQRVNVFYCDTDSILTPDTMDTSENIGLLKKEYEISSGIIVRPKMYSFNTKDKSFVKIKGLPMAKTWNYDKFKSFMVNPKIEYSKIGKFKECNKRGFSFNEIINTHKDLSVEDTKRLWLKPFCVNETQESKPHTIIERTE